LDVGQKMCIVQGNPVFLAAFLEGNDSLSFFWMDKGACIHIKDNVPLATSIFSVPV